jgi:2'-5' RNA ligase
MQHVVAPLDPDHVRAAHDLIDQLRAATGVPEPAPPCWEPHVTLVSYVGLPRAVAVEALQEVATATAPFVVRAHGYGFFTGDAPSELCLFVPVVRDGEIDQLQRRLGARLEDAGATLCGQSRPAVWTPHITLLDRCLDPARLSVAVGHLAGRPHPSWNVRLDHLEVDRTALELTGPVRRQDRPRRHR